MKLTDFLEWNQIIILRAAISTLSENILKCTKFIEIFGIFEPIFTEEFLYVSSAFVFGKNLDKSFMSILIKSKTSEITLNALMFIDILKIMYFSFYKIFEQNLDESSMSVQ